MSSGSLYVGVSADTSLSKTRFPAGFLGDQLPVAATLSADYAAETTVVADGHDGVLGLGSLDHGGAGGHSLVCIHVKAELPVGFGDLGRAVENVAEDVGSLSTGYDGE